MNYTLQVNSYTFPSFSVRMIILALKIQHKMPYK